MIQVAIPVDFDIVAQTRSPAFARATPLRVDRLVSLALADSLGVRAPREKLERVLRRTLRALAAGEFAVDVDGRRYTRPDDVVVASGTVALRFYAVPAVADELSTG